MDVTKKHLLWIRSNCNPAKIDFLKERLGDPSTLERTYKALTKAVGALILQEPKQAEIYTNNGYADVFCPSCGDMIFSLEPGEHVEKQPSHCLWCGQKLAWGCENE